MLEAISAGLFSLFTPQALLFMMIGILYGLVIGILPGGAICYLDEVV